MRVKVSNIATKVLGEAEEYGSGYMKFAIKALVESVGGVEDDEYDGDVYVTLQGLDDEGLELHEVNMSGYLSPGENREFTTRDEINRKTFNQIVRWQSRS